MKISSSLFFIYKGLYRHGMPSLATCSVYMFCTKPKGYKLNNNELRNYLYI